MQYKLNKQVPQYIKGILHLLQLRNKISSTHRSCYFLQRVKDL